MPFYLKCMFGYTQSLILFAINFLHFFLLFSYFSSSEAPIFLLLFHMKSLESRSFDMKAVTKNKA